MASTSDDTKRRNTVPLRRLTNPSLQQYLPCPQCPLWFQLLLLLLLLPLLFNFGTFGNYGSYGNFLPSSVSSVSSVVRGFCLCCACGLPKARRGGVPMALTPLNNSLREGALANVSCG